MDFCAKCHNILTTIINNDIMKKKCFCGEIVPANDSDTLVYQETYTNNLYVFRNVIRNASRDPTNLKVQNKCRKCGHNFARQVRIGDNMTLITSCIKCGTDTAS